MTRRPIAPLAAALLLPAALHAQPATPEAAKAAPAKAAPAKAAPVQRPAATTRATPQPTPMSERTAVIGVLDKRLGTTGEFTLKPGERFSFGRIAGVLQGCEKTQPFERPQSAAFVQVSETPARLQGKPQEPVKRVFSGWLFAESPSLNPFVHPVYDVWLKSCTMRFPDGPKAASSATGSAGKATRSRPAAPKPATAAPAAAPAPATPEPTPGT
ncbi:DUF2155 domain-containing protein [Sandaracinobacter neustonicus]|uniref:DUF2155 domain-containing protein n=1 Tax=Sandaracinobacter neustonicus TaxID=1715348 RepID=A0A501XPC7_9SPHN|nr:DUF2155 domain-containing protein [Sandaracinobacter neustonicus]